MRRARPAALAALAFAIAALAGCGGGDRADHTADTAFAPIDSTAKPADSTQHAPTDSVRRDSTAAAPDTMPLLLVAVDSAIGDSLYQKSRGRCLSCHGPRGAGNASLGPSLRDSIWVDTDGSVAGITTVIREGVAVPKAGTARMPAFGNQLDSTSIHRLAVYVYSLSHPGQIAVDSAAARAALPIAPVSGAAADTTVH